MHHPQSFVFSASCFRPLIGCRRSLATLPLSLYVSIVIPAVARILFTIECSFSVLLRSAWWVDMVHTACKCPPQPTFKLGSQRNSTFTSLSLCYVIFGRSNVLRQFGHLSMSMTITALKPKVLAAWEVAQRPMSMIQAVRGIYVRSDGGWEIA